MSNKLTYAQLQQFWQSGTVPPDCTVDDIRDNLREGNKIFDFYYNQMQEKLDQIEDRDVEQMFVNYIGKQVCDFCYELNRDHVQDRCIDWRIEDPDFRAWYRREVAKNCYGMLMIELIRGTFLDLIEDEIKKHPQNYSSFLTDDYRQGRPPLRIQNTVKDSSV